MTRPQGGSTARRLPVALAVALGALLLLMGAPTTSASWTDSTSTATVQIRGGALTAALTQSGPHQYVHYVNNVVPGNVVRSLTGTPGLIPGREGQSWVYTVTNSTAAPQPSTARARVSFAVRTAATQGPWSQVWPYVVVSYSLDGNTFYLLPSSGVTASGISYDLNFGGSLAPGQSATIYLSLYIPAEVNGEDVPFKLRTARSATADARQMLTMRNVLTLTQVAR